MTVPKIIHCFWAGGPKTRLAEKCLASWRRYAPDFEIREFELPAEVPDFVRGAVAAGRWAMVSDWVRMRALYDEGGVYLDLDVELVAPLDELVGREWIASEWKPGGGTWLNPGSGIALKRGSPLAAAMLADYAQLAFDPAREMMPWINARLAGHLSAMPSQPEILPPEVLSPIDLQGDLHRTPRTRGIHHYAMSDSTPVRRLSRWLHWHGLGWIFAWWSQRRRTERADVVHVLAGLEATSGVANIMRRFARVQRERGMTVAVCATGERSSRSETDGVTTCVWRKSRLFGFVYLSWGLLFGLPRMVKGAEEVWVHCSWTFPVWYGAWLVRRYGQRLTVVPEGSFDPKRLHNHAGWKKRLVAPLDRWVLRVADEVLALCPDEVDWIRAFEPRAKVRLARVPLFLPEVSAVPAPVEPGKLHVLFLGRVEDPLKGVRFLRDAAARCGDAVELRVVSDHVGEALERDWTWCDVLCLPTLSDNFGLVVAEALERGKRVITTDGASAWGSEAESNNSLIYLQGFRDGTDEARVAMLVKALRRVGGLREEKP